MYVSLKKTVLFIFYVNLYFYFDKNCVRNHMNKFDAEGALGEFFSECEEILQRVSALMTN